MYFSYIFLILWESFSKDLFAFLAVDDPPFSISTAVLDRNHTIITIHLIYAIDTIFRKHPFFTGIHRGGWWSSWAFILLYYYYYDFPLFFGIIIICLTRRFVSAIGPRRIPARLYYIESSPPHAKRAESIEMPGIPFFEWLIDDVGAQKAYRHIYIRPGTLYFSRVLYTGPRKRGY